MSHQIVLGTVDSLYITFCSNVTIHFLPTDLIKANSFVSQWLQPVSTIVRCYKELNSCDIRAMVSYNHMITLSVPFPETEDKLECQKRFAVV